jgi:hypothetical protein
MLNRKRCSALVEKEIALANLEACRYLRGIYKKQISHTRIKYSLALPIRRAIIKYLEDDLEDKLQQLKASRTTLATLII